MKGFNFTACADDFLQIYADGKIMGHTRAINTSYTAVIPDGTKVLALKLVLLCDSAHQAAARLVEKTFFVKLYLPTIKDFIIN